MPDAGGGLDGGDDFGIAKLDADATFQLGEDSVGIGDVLSGFNAGQDDAPEVAAHGGGRVSINVGRVDADKDFRAGFADLGYRRLQGLAGGFERRVGDAVLQVDGDGVGVAVPGPADHAQLEWPG